MSAPLVPTGTLRARFAHAGLRGDAVEAVFRRLGVGARGCDLGDEGLYLAEELVGADRWLGGSDQTEALAILVLALMLAQRQGSSCLSLDPKDPEKRLRTLVGDIVRLADARLDVPRVLRTIANLTATPRFNSVIGVGDARAPLIVDQGALYTERSRWLEVRVAARLRDRLGAHAAPAAVPIELTLAASAALPVAAMPSGPIPVVTVVADGSKPTATAPAHEMGAGLDAARITEARLDAIMAELAAQPGARALSEEQAAAVRLALGGRLTVITGGPGTGKTVVAAAVVRGLARLGCTEIVLAAQTGKAANRLTEVIGQQLAAIAGVTAGGGAAHAVDVALAARPPAAQTLHRLLGYRGGRWAHHALSPLPVDAVIVDEASMIDLELMDALLDAMPAGAPLVLIGDAHQLPAIDAGQILADLVDHGSARIAHLRRSYRMNPEDPAGRAVYAAAQAVNEGAMAKLFSAAAPLAVARTPGRLAFTGVEWVDPAADGRPLAAAHATAKQLWHAFGGPAALESARTVFRFVDGAIDPAQSAELEALWASLGRARILTATRALDTGAIAINAHLHELALTRMSVTGKPELVPGEPVMITANDYQRGLFNGDQGIIVRADEGLDRHHYRAVFRCQGVLRPFAIEALRDRLELAWALTVHKSQGSELDAVAVILPGDDLPLVTRELLYTGITRARTSVVLCGTRAILMAAGKRRALRYSGLPARLGALPAGLGAT